MSRKLHLPSPPRTAVSTRVPKLAKRALVADNAKRFTGPAGGVVPPESSGLRAYDLMIRGIMAGGLVGFIVGWFVGAA